MNNENTDSIIKNDLSETAPEATKAETVELSGSTFEVSATPENNIAICVIKPDAFIKKDDIVKRLEGSGLFVVKRKTLILPEDFVIKEMYGKDKLPGPLEEATKRHFLSGPSEILVVKGDNVVSKLVDLVGLKTNPALCNLDTIRYIYGDHIPEELGGDLKFYRNAAHRPLNEQESKEDLKKFKNLL